MRRSALIAGLIAAAASLAFAPTSSEVVAFAKDTSPSAGEAMPRLYRNCTNYNKRYPHGVGRLLARDKTSGTPVTNFKRSTVLYNTGMRYNRGLDRDKDGIACEKR